MQKRDIEFLAVLFDELVPPREDRKLAGAGRSEIVATVQEKIDAVPDLAKLIDAGMAAIQKQAEQRGAAFQSLPHEQRVEVLRSVEAAQPFFMPLLLLHVYGSYYQQPDVLTAQGYPARPLFPEGHDLESDDEALLEKLRARIGRP